ncbi:MAG: hypothetical protein AB1648_11340 [Pseudomonadota bacterium]
MGFVSSFKDQAIRTVVSELLASQSETTNYQSIARAHDLGVRGRTLERWVRAVQDGLNLSGDKTLQRVDARIMEDLGVSPAVQVRTRDVRASKTRLRSASTSKQPPILDLPPAHLCRVLHYGDDTAPSSAPRGSGTGFRLTDRLILTCRHVLPEQIADCTKVVFKFPVFNSEYAQSSPGAQIHLVKSYESTRIADHASVLLESPQGGDETDDWSSGASLPAEKSFDFALLEINYDKPPKWEVRIEGTLRDIGSVNLHMFITELKEGTPPLDPPVAPLSAEELANHPVEVRLITDGLWYRSLPGGISMVNPKVQRVRYNQKGTERGDSGAPLVEIRDGHAIVVAIHQAATDQGGQAIPIGPILESIYDSNLDQTHKTELESFGWLPGS